MSLDILYVGEPGGTCRQRARALESLGHRVRTVAAGLPASRLLSAIYRAGAKFKRPPDLHGANRAILQALRARRPDVLWIDKGLTIRATTLSRVRRISPRTAIVAYSPDDMMNPSNQSMRYFRTMALYDLHVTTKSYHLAELRDLGARSVMFVDNAFDPETHRPHELSQQDRRKYAADVGFIGGCEADRAEQMWSLADAGIEVHVWGYRWDRWSKPHPRLIVDNTMLHGAEYAKAIGAIRINLGFLRKANRDLQTTRSIEIPACRAFMLAERTDEHLRLFEEGREAEFFGSFAELLRKCRYYLDHEDERLRIAEAGYRRCIEGRYSNQDRLAAVLRRLEELGRLDAAAGPVGPQGGTLTRS